MTDTKSSHIEEQRDVTKLEHICQHMDKIIAEAEGIHGNLCCLLDRIDGEKANEVDCDSVPEDREGGLLGRLKSDQQGLSRVLLAISEEIERLHKLL